MKKVYLISVIMALAVGIAVYAFASSLQRQAAEASNVELTSVVVAAIDIPGNTLIQEGMVMVRSIPTDAVNSRTLTDISAALNKITRAPLFAGEQVLPERLGETGEAADSLSLQFESPYRAITIPVDEVTGVAGYIKAGDHVDLVATLIYPTLEGEVSYAVSTMLVENIQVLRTGVNTLSSTDSAGALYSSVTLMVTPDQALKINYAATNGKLRLLLRNIFDTEEVQPADYPQFTQANVTDNVSEPVAD